MSRSKAWPPWLNLRKWKFNFESISLRAVIILALAFPLCVNFLLINLLYFTNRDISHHYLLALESQKLSASTEFLDTYIVEMEKILDRSSRSESKIENDFFILFALFGKKIDSLVPLVKKDTPSEEAFISIQQRTTEIGSLQTVDGAKPSVAKIREIFKDIKELENDFQKQEKGTNDIRSKTAEGYVRYSQKTLVWFMAIIILYYIAIGYLLKKSFFTTLGRILNNLRSAKNETFLLTEPSSKKSELSVVECEIYNLYTKLEDRRMENQAFVYSVSHDLRSPLLSIQSFVSELKNGVSNIETELSKKGDLNFNYLNKVILEIKESIDFVDASSSKITVIIESLLMLSKAGRVSIHIEEVNLEPKIKNILQSIEAVIRLSRSKILLNELPLIYSDRNALNQIFLNLITNSIKFKHPERDLILEIGLDKEKTDIKYYAIYIKDNGSGIDLNYLDKIFLPFGQLKTTSKSGTGLGLSIVKKYLDRTGGKLSVESTLGVGTTFTIYFLKDNMDIDPVTT